MMRMKKGLRHGMILACAATLVSLAAVSRAPADEVKLEELVGRKFARIALGGVLYDNWLSELGVKRESTHPSYPEAGQKKGAATWRCKECHGWDYKGKAGAYSKGSHYTGITGIRAFANQSPKKVLKILDDETHKLGDLISQEAMESLALFVAYGQLDMDVHINRMNKKVNGKAVNGGRIYQATCVKCHGEDGREINFKDEAKPEYIGTVAKENPWETLHKIRWGQPGEQMISLLFMSLQDQLDVLAFCQTLPEK